MNWNSVLASEAETVRGRSIGVMFFAFLATSVAVGSVGVLWQSRNTPIFAAVGAGRETHESYASSSEEILSALGKHMIIPRESKAPEVAIIDDPGLLEREQPFYRGSIRGDALVVFPESKRALIFSPSRERIVVFGSVVVAVPKSHIATPTLQRVAEEPASVIISAQEKSEHP